MNKGFRLAQDRKRNKTFIPVVKRETDEPPPIIVAIVGPAKVGKSTLVRSLVKHYTKQKMNRVDGPITVVSGKYRRITFIESGSQIARSDNRLARMAAIPDYAALLHARPQHAAALLEIHARTHALLGDDAGSRGAARNRLLGSSENGERTTWI